MTVKITRPSIDIRGTLDELNKPSGIAGNAMLAAETPQEQFNLIGAGRRNLIINGGFDVWQRGTSFTPTGADYMADRWFMGGGDYACTATKQASTLPDGSEVNTMRISYTASGTNYIDLYQGIENFKALSGKTVTLSCWIKTNISSLSYRQYSTQQFGSVAVADGQWHKLVSTVQLGAITGVNRGANSPFFGPTSGGTIVTKSGDYFEITQFQLELGSVATPFEHRSYGEELALCQRYYCQSYESGTLAGSVTYEGALFRYLDGTHNWATFPFQFPTPMRLKPSMRIYNPATGALNSMSNDASNKVCGITAHGTQTARARISNITTYQSTSFTFHYTADAEL